MPSLPAQGLSTQKAPPAPPAAAIAFANKLLAKMTLEEKVGQMSQVAMNSDGGTGVEQQIAEGKVGSLLFVTDPVELNRLQKIAVEQSRLHIPLIVGFDVIHGFRTIFPVPLAMASSWNPALIERAQSLAAREARAVGVDWAFAPMVDIARDPRWGRIMEGAGEDPFLGSKIAAAQVRGFQGTDLASNDSIIACVKHFGGYGAAVGGRDYDSSDISDNQLYNVYLPAYHAAVDAGAGSVMSAYMDLNSVPATGNKFLLTDTLRTQWKFPGFVVSDWDSIKSLTTHGFSSDDEDAAVRAVNAGVDMEMTSHTYRDHLAQAVREHKVSLTTIDNATRRILIAKYDLGLFKNPYVDVDRSRTVIGSPEIRTEARHTATQTAILLKNDNNLLPLKKDVRTLALIGPMIDSKPDTLGSWSLAGDVKSTVTLLDGLQHALPSTTKLLSTKGVEIERVQPSIFDSQFPSPKPQLTTEAERKKEFDHAIDLVRSSDVAVLALGEAQNMNGERASRSTLVLPGEQEKLLEAAVATGKPIVLLLMTGRPLNITWASQHVPAILNIWYPGSEGGNAVADLLFGEANPGGKLTVSWPVDVGQVPIFYARQLTQIPDHPETRYWDGTSAPLYPFGFGLSYSTFSITGLTLDKPDVVAGASLTASVDVENTSDREGSDIIQLYTHQRAGSASRPVRELKGFQRIVLKAHEHRRVQILLDTKDLAFWSPQTKTQAIEPGSFDLWMGDSSEATLHQQFRVSSNTHAANR
ncbi:MAG: beta-glucosidase BglX [Edaphobacter sp.]|uniref:beta-glucosidase BglX n=1 Tax=Edaphobacter sp. TaxID=1934404 RepID=UPI0023976BAB|nr:beta-glucosidase BglX [Edaphobacter sp.]MDE1175327.1 beta-glucosidase BglX [Edaphobacter sp.]